MFNGITLPTSMEIERYAPTTRQGELAELYTKCVTCCAAITPVRVINHETEHLIGGEPRTDYRLNECPDCRRITKETGKLPVLPIPPSCLGLTWSQAMRRGS